MDWLEDVKERADPAFTGNAMVDFQYSMIFINMFPDPDDASTWVALQNLLGRDYWERVW
jgi:hypothetical protein